MATTYSGTMSFNLKGLLTKALDIGTGTLNVDYTKRYTVSNGTGADQANMIWTDTRTLSASASEDLDLYGGLTNAFGDTMNFSAIKGVFIFAASGNTNNVLIGGDGSAPVVGWVGNGSDIVVVKPGGMFCLYDPSAGGSGITNTTADILQIANSSSGSSVDYDIMVLGEV
jgi:hypothetical protein